jgi:hypothetical protein
MIVTMMKKKSGGERQGDEHAYISALFLLEFY